MKLKNLFPIFSFALCTISIAYSMDDLGEFDPVNVVAVINNELDLSGVTKRRWEIDKEHLQKAAVLFARYYITGKQDAACCIDTGAKECFKRSVEKQDFYRHITHNIAQKELNQIFQEQCAWAEQQPEINDRGSLRWIERYSFDSFGDTPRLIIIPQEEWKDKRSAALLEIKEQFALK